MMRFFIWYQVKVKNFNGLGPALGHVIYNRYKNGGRQGSGRLNVSL